MANSRRRPFAAWKCADLRLTVGSSLLLCVTILLWVEGPPPSVALSGAAAQTSREPAGFRG